MGADNPNASGDMIIYEPAVLRSDKYSPAHVFFLCMKTENGQRSVKFLIRRDLSVRLRSYTMAYRFSPEPVEHDASKDSFSRIVCSKPDINTKELKSFSGRIPDGFDFRGFGAYICEVEYEDGTKEYFDNTDYITPTKDKGIPSDESDDKPFDDGVEWAANAADYAAILSASSQRNADGAASDEDRAARDGFDDYPSMPRARKRTRARILVPILILLLVLGAAASLRFYTKKSLESTVDSLIAESRFTEAYMIAMEKNNAELADKAARAAVDSLIRKGDLKEAYVFATIVGENDRVTNKALEVLSSMGEDALDSEALSVALKSTDEKKFDAVIIGIVESLVSTGSYEQAMNATSYIRNAQLREDKAGDVYNNALAFFAEKADVDGTVAFVRRYGANRPFDGHVDEAVISAIMSACEKSGNRASEVFLSEYFGFDYSEIEIVPNDAGVRASLSTVYRILTEEQKRIYHSSPLVCYKEAFLIQDGSIEGTDITDAIGVDTYEYRTVVLHKDGRVSMLDNGGHNETDDIPEDLRAVQAVCGQHHTVVLLADGTCRAFGDNSYGQCDVEAWEDVVSIAAGRNFTVGLRSDGTLVACGSNREKQCDVGDYRNVVDVFACDQTTVILFSDGTVHIQGDTSLGLYSANRLENVEEMSCHANTVVARHVDGKFTVICAALNASAGTAEELTGATAFAAGSTSIAFTDADGELRIIGYGYTD